MALLAVPPEESAAFTVEKRGFEIRKENFIYV